jgi:hypothetical protein
MIRSPSFQLYAEVSDLRRYSNTRSAASLAVGFSSAFLRGAIMCSKCDTEGGVIRLKETAAFEMHFC